MKQLTICILATMLLLSCSKKDSKTNTNPGGNNPDPGIVLNDHEKLLIGKWFLEKSIDSLYSGTTFDGIDVRTFYPCHEDDKYVFSADKKYYKDEGADTCSASGEIYGLQDWSIEVGSGYFKYKHGPGLMYADGFFRKIDDNHIAVYSTHYLYNNKSRVRTYYYTRK